MPRRIALFTENLSVKALARLQYVLDWLQSHPLSDASRFVWRLNPTNGAFDVALHYGVHGAVFMPSDADLMTASTSTPNDLICQAFETDSGKVYAVKNHGTRQRNHFFENGTFGFDVFATLFFHLSRREEYQSDAGSQNPHGDFDEEQSLLIRSGIYQQPICDQLAVAFFSALGLNVRERPSTILLSHDIDHLQQWKSPLGALRYLLWVSRRHGNLRAVPRVLRDAWAVWRGQIPDAADTFDWLLSDRSDIEKNIFFPVGGDTVFDRFYPLGQATPVLKKAREKGYRVGLHPSYAAWKEPDIWSRERRKWENWTGEGLRHSRQHFLHFAFPETADILESEQLEVDHSLGYRNHIGFRCGTGFAYHLYNFSAEKPYRWKAQPLALMDVALLREIDFKQHQLVSEWQNFFEKNRSNTCLSLNFHNTFFYEFELQGWPLKDLYLEMFARSPH
ncbi:MAG: hypothetical protein IPL65_18430 [Lewinellaceae bacterium]|nr:hypothetical protein [Lewinellaceae bacterium]